VAAGAVPTAGLGDLSQPSGPVARVPRAVAELCGEHTDAAGLRDVDDAELYEDLVHAVRVASIPDRRPAPATDLGCPDALLDRLGRGWFAGRGPRSPQAHYSATGELPRVELRDPPPDTVSLWWRKPVGALWTSSFLPDGGSAWRYGEAAEFGDRRRRLFAMAFDPAAVVAYVIDGPADYVRLVERFPLRYADGTRGVRWRAVAEEFDAVRLTARGLLLTEDVPVHGHPPVAPLAGWNAESTAWLRVPAGTTISPFDDARTPAAPGPPAPVIAPRDT
jgi:hypothetical protein